MRSDVFSLGVVLHELLSGRRIFERNSLFDTLNAVVREEPPALESPAAELVKQCLAKQPSRRFQTMADVKAALLQLRSQRIAPAHAAPSIAVLPFANMSRDPDDEYFSDGLKDEIINALAQVPGLKVIARTSAFAFKGKNDDVRRIADMLGVTNVLEGSVRRAGGRVRVMAQLILAADGTHLWSQRYDREMTDIFAIQDEIAAAIADALKVKLNPAPEHRMRACPPTRRIYATGPISGCSHRRPRGTAGSVSNRRWRSTRRSRFRRSGLLITTSRSGPWVASRRMRRCHGRAN